MGQVVDKVQNPTIIAIQYSLMALSVAIQCYGLATVIISRQKGRTRYFIGTIVWLVLSFIPAFATAASVISFFIWFTSFSIWSVFYIYVNFTGDHGQVCVIEDLYEKKIETLKEMNSILSAQILQLEQGVLQFVQNCEMTIPDKKERKSRITEYRSDIKKLIKESKQIQQEMVLEFNVAFEVELDQIYQGDKKPAVYDEFPLWHRNHILFFVMQVVMCIFDIITSLAEACQVFNNLGLENPTTDRHRLIIAPNAIQEGVGDLHFVFTPLGIVVNIIINVLMDPTVMKKWWLFPDDKDYIPENRGNFRKKTFGFKFGFFFLNQLQNIFVLSFSSTIQKTFVEDSGTGLHMYPLLLLVFPFFYSLFGFRIWKMLARFVMLIPIFAKIQVYRVKIFSYFFLSFPAFFLFCASSAAATGGGVGCFIQASCMIMVAFAFVAGLMAEAFAWTVLVIVPPFLMAFCCFAVQMIKSMFFPFSFFTNIFGVHLTSVTILYQLQNSFNLVTWKECMINLLVVAIIVLLLLNIVNSLTALPVIAYFLMIFLPIFESNGSYAQCFNRCCDPSTTDEILIEDEYPQVVRNQLVMNRNMRLSMIPIVGPALGLLASYMNSPVLVDSSQRTGYFIWVLNIVQFFFIMLTALTLTLGSSSCYFFLFMFAIFYLADQWEEAKDYVQSIDPLDFKGTWFCIKNLFIILQFWGGKKQYHSRSSYDAYKKGQVHFVKFVEDNKDKPAGLMPGAYKPQIDRQKLLDEYKLKQDQKLDLGTGQIIIQNGYDGDNMFQAVNQPEQRVLCVI